MTGGDGQEVEQGCCVVYARDSLAVDGWAEIIEFWDWVLQINKSGVLLGLMKSHANWIQEQRVLLTNFRW